jgi:hypothetical protein
MSTKTAIQRETFALTLDPTVPLSEQVRMGTYGELNGNYKPENFTLTLTGNREVVLFDPQGAVSSEEMIARMKAEGYVPALIDDALAMGVQYPDRQKKNAIVFLGTLFHDHDSCGDERVPLLDGWEDVSEGGRLLLLGWFGNEWPDGCRFAAVRES